MLRRLAWTMLGATVVLVVADVVVSAQAVPLTSETAIAVHGFPFVEGACVGCALMGALITSRYQRHPIGWLLSVVGICIALSLLTEAYAYWVLESDGPGTRTMGGVSAWVSQLLGGQLAVALLALMYLLAPDGRFLSSRWRYAALVPGVGAMLCVAAILSVDPRRFDLVGYDAQFGWVRRLLLSGGFSLISLGMLIAVVSMVQRLRLSAGEERQRLQPVALSAALATMGLVVMAVVQAANGGVQTWLSAIPLLLAFFLMPILFAVAVLRYRLYELDVIINRTAVVATGAAFAAVGYTALVVLAGRQVVGSTGGFWVSFAATVLVALAFQPVRRLVLRLANRAAYGARAEPYEALADFSRRLADAPDPDDLLPAVAEAAARAVSARGAQATLEIPGGEPVSGSWGWWAADQEGPPDHEVPVRTGTRILGRIAVVLPRGRTVRTSDQRLLEALADQTAVAFGNTSLAGTVADRVAELDRATTELARSRQRLIAADDGARRALEAAIARQVMPFLASLPDQIRQERVRVESGRAVDLERLVSGTTEALEALRELTRGVFPAQLARSGLAPTLRSLLAPFGGAGQLSVSGNGTRRHSARVEAAVYFCCAEAVRGTDRTVSVDLGGEDGTLLLEVRGAREDLDLRAITDRVAAVSGRVRAEQGTVRLDIPVAAPEAGSPVLEDATGLLPGG